MYLNSVSILEIVLKKKKLGGVLAYSTGTCFQRFYIVLKNTGFSMPRLVSKSECNVE